MAAYVFFCRICGGLAFKVAWYNDPINRRGEKQKPGWTMECLGCKRVTIVPEKPDFSEMEKI